jgi:hypothetical protein
MTFNPLVTNYNVTLGFATGGDLSSGTAAFKITPTYNTAYDYNSVQLVRNDTQWVEPAPSGTEITYWQDGFSAAYTVRVRSQHPNYTKNYIINLARNGVIIGVHYPTLQAAMDAQTILYLNEDQNITVASPINISSVSKYITTVPGQTGEVQIGFSGGTYGFNLTGSGNLYFGYAGDPLTGHITISGRNTSGFTIVNMNGSNARLYMRINTTLQNSPTAVYFTSAASSSSRFTFTGGTIANCTKGVDRYSNGEIVLGAGVFYGNGQNVTWW